MDHNYILNSELKASESAARPQMGAGPDRPLHPAFFDMVFACLVLIVLSPLLTVLALFIVIGGRHPIFFQERVGYQGRSFWIYKFRTMPDEGWDAAQLQARESLLASLQLAVFRRVSAVLRNTGLDELPQFANILRGEMQIIGPRPLMKIDFMDLPERRYERCSVLPGITGLAQINGGQDLDSESKLALDLYLIAHSSRNIAVKIVMRTILRILGFSSATAKASEADLARAMSHTNARHCATTAIPVVQPARDRRPLRSVRRSAEPPAAALRAAAIQKPRATQIVLIPTFFRKLAIERSSGPDGAPGTAPRRA